MKKVLFSIMMLCCMGVNAQTTYSRYDVNHDSKIDMSDVAILINRILGKINYPVIGIELSYTNAYLEVGKTTIITSTVIPSDADDMSVTWSSSDSNIASVSSDGKVTGVAEGAATITCTANDGSEVKAICQVKVRKPDTKEYVDLGLSVKWATCNVGASSPEEYGDYFAWSETTPKDSYSWSNLKYCNGSKSTLTKYCTSSEWGTVDNKSILESSDDTATAKWGVPWRMPTKSEQDELRNNCTWTWTTQNGVKGYIIMGLNGNYIFLPAAGYYGDSTLKSAGTEGSYRSSTLYSGGCYSTYDLDFTYSYINWDNGHRFYGRSVRPVCP